MEHDFRTVRQVRRGTIWYHVKLDLIGLWDKKVFGMWTRHSGFRRFFYSGPWQYFDTKTNKQIKDPNKLGYWVKIGEL